LRGVWSSESSLGNLPSPKSTSRSPWEELQGERFDIPDGCRVTRVNVGLGLLLRLVEPLLALVDVEGPGVTREHIACARLKVDRE